MRRRLGLVLATATAIGVAGVLVAGPAGAGRNLPCEPGSGPLQAPGAVITSDQVGFGADLKCANLGGADLSGLSLSQQDLTGAILTGADLSDADLTQADLTGAHAAGANFDDATLIQAHLEDADLSDAILTNANLSQTEADGVDMSGADLTGADLTQATLTDADLSGADFSGAHLIQADFDGANVEGVKGVTAYADYVWYACLGLAVLFLLGSIRRAFKPVIRPNLFGTMAMAQAMGQTGYGGYQQPYQQQYQPMGGYQPQYPNPVPPPPPAAPAGTVADIYGTGLGPPPPPPMLFGAQAGGFSAPPPPPAGWTPPNPAAVGQPTRNVGPRLVFGIIGSLILAVGIHLAIGGAIGTFAEMINPLAAGCEGFKCKIGSDTGATGLVIGPFAAIIGGVIRGRG